MMAAPLYSGYPETFTVTVRTPAERLAVEKALAMAQELHEVATAAGPGQVLDQCEEAVVAKGREFMCTMLERTVQQRIEAEEKKSRFGTVTSAARAGTTKGRTRKGR
jgi:hypothetical protein